MAGTHQTWPISYSDERRACTPAVFTSSVVFFVETLLVGLVDLTSLAFSPVVLGSTLRLRLAASQRLQTLSGNLVHQSRSVKTLSVDNTYPPTPNFQQSSPNLLPSPLPSAYRSLAPFWLMVTTSFWWFDCGSQSLQLRQAKIGSSYLLLCNACNPTTKDR